MIISHAIGDFLFELFSQLKGKTAYNELITPLQYGYYAYGEYKPITTIKDSWALPDQLSTLQIPFDKEFEVAQSMYSAGKE